MALLYTPDTKKGWKAPDFSLRGVDGKNHSLSSASGEKGLVVMFICNHCPYVKSITNKLVRDMTELSEYGIGSIAICSNDADSYPEDGFDAMKQFAAEQSFPFPYIWDEDQSIARAYDAVCTPDFFGFDKELCLQYRGRLDDAGMQDRPESKRDLFEAMKQVSLTGAAPATQHNSMGCSIKWK